MDENECPECAPHPEHEGRCQEKVVVDYNAPNTEEVTDFEYKGSPTTQCSCVV